MNIGVVAGYLSVLVLSLYIQDVSGFAGITNIGELAEQSLASTAYKRPQMLWPIALLLLYWITRVWFVAHRDEMHDDPVVFAGRDPISYIVGILMAGLALGSVI